MLLLISFTSPHWLIEIHHHFQGIFPTIYKAGKPVIGQQILLDIS